MGERISDHELYYDLWRYQTAAKGPVYLEPRHYCDQDVSLQLERLIQAGLITMSMRLHNRAVLAKITVRDAGYRTLEELYPEFGVNNGRFRESW